MGIVTEMPNGTPTTNTLDAIPEDLLGEEMWGDEL